MSVACRDCGVSYASLGCDLVLPDQQWKAIFPEEGGVLCANCICRRARKVGGTAVLAWIDNVDYSLGPIRPAPRGTVRLAERPKRTVTVK